MKSLRYILIGISLCTLPQCSVHRKVNTTKVESVKTKNISDYSSMLTKSVDSVISASNIKQILSTDSKDITIKNSSTPFEIKGSNFITKAKFNFDTTSTQDTIKYIDMDNPDLSLKVYTNKRTGEMVAEVKTKDKKVKIPTSEVSIKTLTTQSNKDSSITKIDVSKKLKDSITKKETEVKNKIKQIDKQIDKKSFNAIIPIVVAIILLIIAIFTYLYIKNKK